MSRAWLASSHETITTRPGRFRGGLVFLGPTATTTPSASLRSIDLTLPRIEANLALDEALLVAAEEHDAGPSLRFWEPDHPAVVLGASCRLGEDVRVENCRAEGVPIARRSSGGGTVVVGPGTLNVAVVLSVEAAPGLVAVDHAQKFVLERIAAGLRELGPPAEVRGSGDLVLGDRKFAGSAQRRLRRFFLVHATLIHALPLDLIERLTRPPRRQPDYREGRGHLDFLTSIPLPRERLVEAIQRAWNVLPGENHPVEVPGAIIATLLAEKYDAPGWVERL